MYLALRRCESVMIGCIFGVSILALYDDCMGWNLAIDRSYNMNVIFFSLGDSYDHRPHFKWLRFKHQSTTQLRAVI